MFIATKHNNGYENTQFAKLADRVVDTKDIFYIFNKGDISVIFEDGVTLDDLFNQLNGMERITVLFRRMSDNDSFFGRVCSIMGVQLDRPYDSLNTSRIPKMASELKKLMYHENKITWYACFGKNAALRNAAKIELPVVYKSVNGSHGEGIELIETKDQLIGKINNHDFSDPIFLQEFISKKFEYRVITWDKQVINCIRKMGVTRKLFKGRKFVAIELPQDYVDYIKRNAKDGLLGIDIVRDVNGKIFIIEENRAPEFERLDEVTGKDTAKLILDAMEKQNYERQ